MRSLRALFGIAALCALLPGQEPPAQPIPFSHKTHAGQGIKCTDCHAIREPGFQAGFPREMVCMGCHSTIKKESPAIQKLSGFAKSKTPVPWVRIYSVPEFVWFSHALHVKETKLECEACHGAVATRDVLFKEKPVDMASCQACHAKRGASNGCDTCHATR